MMSIDPGLLEAVVGGGPSSPVDRWILDESGKVVVKLFNIAKARALQIMHDGVMRGPPGSKPKWIPIRSQYRSVGGPPPPDY